MRSFRDHFAIMPQPFRHHFATISRATVGSISRALMTIRPSWVLMKICVVGLCIKVVLAGRCIKKINLRIFSDTPHSCINKEHIHAKGYKISSANETFLEITWLNWPGDLIRRWSQRTQQRIAPTSDYLSKSIMTHTALKKQQRKRRRYLIHGSWLRRPVLIKDHHQYPRCFSHSTHIRCCSNRMLKRNVHAIRFVSSQNACWVYPQSACVKWCFIVLRGLLGTVRNI